MHNIFVSISDMVAVEACIDAMMRINRLSFKPPIDVRPAFFLPDITNVRGAFYRDLEGSEQSKDIDHFIITCETYIDLSPIATVFFTKSIAA